METFLYHMKNAHYVVTDSFHGNCFAIIFQKDYSTFFNTKRGADRFEALLGLFGLISRRIYETDDTVSISPIDYSYANKVINIERERSLAWLNQALKMSVKPKGISDKAGVETSLFPYYATKSYTNKASESFCICPKNACTGCAACANKCPHNAIAMEDDNEGFLYPKIIENACTKCDLCVNVCSVLHPNEKITANLQPRGVYAAYSLDEEIRYMSTSGGAFSEFAKHIFSIGGVCYGAAYDEQFNVHHVRISTLEELPRIRQSKYYQSMIGDVFKQVKKDLDNGVNVLFSGAPCQCAGLSNFLSKEYDNLLILDFICHSINSPKAFRAYLRELEEQKDGKVSRVWFKNKEQNGWKRFSSRVDFTDKDDYYIQHWEHDAFMKGFLKYRMYMRPSCHECSFKEFKRPADVTLADFWGLIWNNPEMTDDMKNGVSAVIINTEKGEAVFDSFVKQNMYIEKHALEDVIPKNGALLHSQKPGLYRDFFFEQVDKIPFSKIVSAIDNREQKRAAEREAAKATPEASSQGGIHGKLTRIGNVVINIHPTASIHINGELVLNAHLPEGSQKECILILHKNAKLIVNGRFNLAYDSVVTIFAGAVLTLNGGFANAGATFGIKGHTVLGKDFLAGRHIVVYDSDFHQIIDVESNERINTQYESINIGDHVWLGEGVSIQKGVTIGNGSIVGAKSLVTKDIPANCLAVGNPARVIKTGVTWKH
jgi:acetyltransferase-like isoleucine patch superfamily enzyme/coenzyme F420-reducing hydrogenase beta subunit